MEQIINRVKALEDFFLGGVFITATDKRGTVLYCNDKILEITSLEISPDCLEEMAHPYDRERLWGDMTGKESDSFKRLFRIKCQDGAYLGVLDNAKAFENSQGKRVWVHMITNVNEMYLKTEQLSLKKSQLEAILQSFSCGVLLCEDDDWYTLSYVSKSLAQMLGYTKKELMEVTKGTMKTIMDADDWERITDHKKQCFLEGPDYAVEYRNRKKNGMYTWMLDCGRKFIDVDGRTRINCVVVDINRDKQLMEELTRSQQKLGIALKRTGLDLWEYDVKQREIIQDERTRSNRPEFPFIIADVPDSLIAAGYYEKESIIEVKKLYEKIRAGAKYAMAEVAYKRALDDNIRWERIHYTNVFDQNGEPVRAIAVAEDITKQKQMEEDYRKEKQYRMAIIADSVSNFAADITSNKVTECSENMLARKADKISFSELTHRTSQKMIHPQFQEAFLAMLDRRELLACYQRGQFEVEIEYLSITKERLYRWQRMRVRLLRNPSTQHIFGYFTIRDVDDSRREEYDRKQLVANALYLAERSSEAKSRYMSRVSHDLRTPLNSIIGLTSLARKNSDNPRKLEQDLEKIDRASANITKILNDFLDVSKMQRGSLGLSQNNFDVRSVLDQVYQTVIKQYKNKEIDIQIEYESNIRWLCGDEKRLIQILTNVIGNAFKFTYDRGRVVIKLSLKHETQDEVVLDFEVQDSGIGIPREEQAVLFETYSSEEKLGRIKGSGLSLAIVKSLCRLMGGDVWVVSELGEGSTFIVELPFEKGQVQEETTKKETRVSLENRWILVVEDNELNAEIVKTILESRGLLVDVANNGLDAVVKVMTQPAQYYCCVLMDIQMPVMDGHEATRRIRNKEKEMNRPAVAIVGMSGDAFDEDVAMAKADGMDDYLIKPLDNNMLFAMIEKMILKEGR